MTPDKGDLWVDYDNGLFNNVTSEGQGVSGVDMLSIVSHLNRKVK
jgi:hypothetical protein